MTYTCSSQLLHPTLHMSHITNTVSEASALVQTTPYVSNMLETYRTYHAHRSFLKQHNLCFSQDPIRCAACRYMTTCGKRAFDIYKTARLQALRDAQCYINRHESFMTTHARCFPYWFNTMAFKTNTHDDVENMCEECRHAQEAP